MIIVVSIGKNIYIDHDCVNRKKCCIDSEFLITCPPKLENCCIDECANTRDVMVLNQIVHLQFLSPSFGFQRDTTCLQVSGVDTCE